MKNALLDYKNEHGLTYEEIGQLCGFPKGSVHLHCSGRRRITAEAAMKYHQGLHIPLSELRPDLWTSRQPAEAE